MHFVYMLQLPYVEMSTVQCNLEAKNQRTMLHETIRFFYNSAAKQSTTFGSQQRTETSMD